MEEISQTWCRRKRRFGITSVSLDYTHIKDLYDLGNMMADSAAKMTGTTVDHKLVGSAWPPFLNKVIAETQEKNIEAVGMPKWSEADQTLANALQKEIGA